VNPSPPRRLARTSTQSATGSDRETPAKSQMHHGQFCPSRFGAGKRKTAARPPAAVGVVVNCHCHEPPTAGTAQIPSRLQHETNTTESPPASAQVLIANSPYSATPPVRSGNGQDYGIAPTKPTTSPDRRIIASHAPLGSPRRPRPRHQSGWGRLLLESPRPGRTRPLLPLEESHNPSSSRADQWQTTRGQPASTSTDGPSAALPTSPVTFSPSTLEGLQQVPSRPKFHAEPTSNAATRRPG